MKDYSVGKGRVICYCDSAEQAFAAHAREGLSKRVGVYEWDAEPRDGGIVITNPRRLPWPKSIEAAE